MTSSSAYLNYSETCSNSNSLYFISLISSFESFSSLIRSPIYDLELVSSSLNSLISSELVFDDYLIGVFSFSISVSFTVSSFDNSPSSTWNVLLMHGCSDDCWLSSSVSRWLDAFIRSKLACSSGMDWISTWARSISWILMSSSQVKFSIWFCFDFMVLSMSSFWVSRWNLTRSMLEEKELLMIRERSGSEHTSNFSTSSISSEYS